MDTYLVGYVSNTGSTKEIAERIGAKLREAGIAVEVGSLDTVASLERYAGCVLGSPVNAMRLLPAFGAFVEKHPDVRGKTLGLFVVSYLYERGRGIWHTLIQRSVNKARLMTRARAYAVFGGKVDREMPAAARAIFGLPKGTPLDIRDWKRIDEWAERMVAAVRGEDV